MKSNSVPEAQMSNEVSHYWGHLIRPMPKQRRDTSEWTLDIQLSRDWGNGLNALPFIARGTFKTRPEAVAHCVQFDRAIIDGTVPGCSVAELLT